MSLRHSTLALALATLLGACVSSDATPDRTARGDELIAKRLAGKVAGPAVSCLPSYRTNNMEVVDRDTILFHEGRTTYRQDTNGQCYPAGFASGYALVTRSLGSSGLCDGDIAHVVDTSSGFFAGSCSFNRFVPYRSR